MTKWRYLRLTVVRMYGGKIKRDKKGPYLELGDRWYLQGSWQEGDGIREGLAQDPDSGLWDREVDILNQLGEQGWELVTADSASYVLKRPSDWVA